MIVLKNTARKRKTPVGLITLREPGERDLEGVKRGHRSRRIGGERNRPITAACNDRIMIGDEAGEEVGEWFGKWEKGENEERR